MDTIDVVTKLTEIYNKLILQPYFKHFLKRPYRDRSMSLANENLKYRT
jgi:hypothetical protein